MVRPGEVVTLGAAGIAFVVGVAHQWASTFLGWLSVPVNVAPVMAQVAASDGLAQLGIYGGIATSIGGALTMLARLYFEDRRDDRKTKLAAIQERLEEAMATAQSNAEKIRAMEASSATMIEDNARLLRMLEEASHRDPKPDNGAA